VALHWTEYPARVETLGDLVSILETLDRDDATDRFTGDLFARESAESAYSVEPTPTGYIFDPRLDRMPGLERLLDRFSLDDSFTLTQLRELRRRAGADLKLDRAALTAMTFTAIADALDQADQRASSTANTAPAGTAATTTRPWTIVIEDGGDETSPRPFPPVRHVGAPPFPLLPLAGTPPARPAGAPLLSVPSLHGELLRRVTSVPPAPPLPEPPPDQVEAAALRLCEAMAGDEFGWAGEDGERLIAQDVAQRGPGIEPSPFTRELVAAFHHAARWLFRAGLVTLELIPLTRVKNRREREERIATHADTHVACLKATPELWERHKAGRIFRGPTTCVGEKPELPPGENRPPTREDVVSSPPDNSTVGEKPERKEGGRPKLGEGPNATPQDRALRNVYELIRGVAQPGRGPKGLLRHFRDNKDFKERVKVAGKDFDEALFKNALAWIKENPDQETESGNDS
jgi:hypothetical protein